MERVSWEGVLGNAFGCVCDSGVYGDVLVYGSCEINVMQKFVIYVKIIIGRMYEIDEQK